MGLRSFLLPATVALLATHCSAEQPKKPSPGNVVENAPGTLVITSPDRAAFIANDTDRVIVRGTGATPALTIDGKPATVAPDGSFEATVSPTVGLNLIVAVDGESRLETPFLYGKFEPANKAVAKAIALEVGAVGVGAPLPDASLASVTNLALEGRDLIASLKGMTFSGQTSGVNWSFAVTGGHHDKPKVSLNTAKKGLGVTAMISGVAVDGNMTIAGVGPRPVQITVDRATVLAESEISVDESKGALKVSVPSDEAYLDGFRFSSGNAGFPCCVDSIVTGFLQPKVQQAIADGIREQVPDALQLTLEGVGLPNEFDFSSMGLPLKVGVQTKFDSAVFDSAGGTLTASALFDGRFGIGSPGAQVPGWLTFGKTFEVVKAKRPSSFGISLSVDAINQLFFAAWGSGGLSYTTPSPFEAKLMPALPPVVAITESGALRLGLGEVQVLRADSPKPFAAATVMQDVSAKTDGDAIVLAPEGEPTISVTWLADGSSGSGSDLVATAAKGQLDKFLKPFRLPIPKLALDKLGTGFTGRSLGMKSATIAVDGNTARLGVVGAMSFVQ